MLADLRKENESLKGLVVTLNSKVADLERQHTIDVEKMAGHIESESASI